MGLVCRVVEEAGIATVCFSTGRDLTAQVRPPRSLFVNFPMGNHFGAAGNADQQRALRSAMDEASKVVLDGFVIERTLQPLFEYPADHIEKLLILFESTGEADFDFGATLLSRAIRTPTSCTGGSRPAE